MLPTTQEYKIAMMIGEDSFRTLQNLEVIPHPSYPNEPWYSTGGLAIVFKIKMKKKFYALKCFYAEANERQERLGHIATYLLQNHSPYFVDFTYLDNELWVETAHGGGGYPVVLMEWIEGKTLDNYLAEICLQPHYHALQNLYFQFCNLAWWLQQQPIAHGDLKHDNIIVTNEGKLKLIDYDGMFVPALQGRKANEQGSPCYQHPQRDTYYFNEHLDDFSLLILQITLLALKQDPSLFKAHYNGDGILLKDTDYPNFAKCSIKAHLWRLDDVKIPLLLSQLQSHLHQLRPIALVPLLQDVEWVNWLVETQKNGTIDFKRHRLNKLLLWNDTRRPLFMQQIERYYYFTESLLEQYEEQWNWENLSKNPSLPWTTALIKKHENRWNWRYLSMNTALPWTIELIERYKDRWNWLNLSRNTALPWTIELIDTYKDSWSWGVFGLSHNTALPWTIELIEKYEDRWQWGASGLSRNIGLPWTIELIDTYKDRWYWDGVGLSLNAALPWTIELIERYKDKWNWNCVGLGRNKGLPWTISLIEKYIDKWDWNDLSYNTSLPWAIGLIEKYEDRWDWNELSSNKGLSWAIGLIEKYEDRWDWNELSSNKGLSWTIGLIEKYEDRWDWKRLSSNTGLPWTIGLIEKYEDRWDWNELSSNTGLPWTIGLIEKYEDRWDWESLSRNKSIYEKVLSPLLDDVFIEDSVIPM